MPDYSNGAFNRDEFFSHFERRRSELKISYFDKYGTIQTFYYNPVTTITKPDDLSEPMVLQGTDNVALLFLLPCKLFNPYLTDRQAAALKDLAQRADLPCHLGFSDYTDYQMYFEDHTSENRLLYASRFLTEWVEDSLRETMTEKTLGKNAKKNAMPLEFRRIFKDQADKGCFDIVPADTMAYVPPSPGGTIEFPNWINPGDYSQWPYPSSACHQKMRADGWLFRFPKPSTHTVLNMAKKYQKLLNDEDAAAPPSPEESLYEIMKKTTAAALDLFKKEVTKKMTKQR